LPLWLALVALVSQAQAAPPKLDYLYPAGASRGQQVTITATGTFGRWPVQAWVDREGVRVEADKDKGKLKVTVEPDAQPGVCYLRLYDDEGASSLRPFVVGTLPEVLEQEPNDDPRKPQSLDASATVNGRLEKSGDVDGYSIALSAGQTLVASMQANNTLGSPMDAVLQVCNSDGLVLEQDDDALGLDPQIIFTAPRGGTYLVRTFAFPVTPNSSVAFAGAETFVYRLTITTGGFVNHTLPMSVERGKPTEVQLFGWNIPPSLSKLTVEPADGLDSLTLFDPQLGNCIVLPVRDHLSISSPPSSGAAQPQPITLPATITGRIDAPRDVDTFSFDATKGQKISFRVESRSLGYPLDAVLAVTDTAGKSLAEVDDPDRTQRDAALTFTAAADGTYHVAVRDLHHHGGFRYAYRLTAEPLTPDFALTLATDTFTLSPGKPLEIPITIDRRNGFNQEIEITAANLPAGVTAEPAKSLPTGDTSKTVKLKLTAITGSIAAPIQILGQSPADKPLSRAARFPIPGLTATHTNAWLSVGK
jgi:hypothetical protein